MTPEEYDTPAERRLAAEIVHLKANETWHHDERTEKLRYRWKVECDELAAENERLKAEVEYQIGYTKARGNQMMLDLETINRLKAEVERLTSPQVREIDMGVNEELIEERDKARADLAEAVEACKEQAANCSCCVGSGHYALIEGGGLRPCEYCASVRAVVAKHKGTS